MLINEADTERTQLIKLRVRDIKRIIKTIFHMFKEVEEKLNMLRRDTEDIKKDSKF